MEKTCKNCRLDAGDWIRVTKQFGRFRYGEMAQIGKTNPVSGNVEVKGWGKIQHFSPEFLSEKIEKLEGDDRPVLVRDWKFGPTDFVYAPSYRNKKKP